MCDCHHCIMIRNYGVRYIASQISKLSDKEFEEYIKRLCKTSREVMVLMRPSVIEPAG